MENNIKNMIDGILNGRVDITVNNIFELINSELSRGVYDTLSPIEKNKFKQNIEKLYGFVRGNNKKELHSIMKRIFIMDNEFLKTIKHKRRNKKLLKKSIKPNEVFRSRKVIIKDD